MRTALAVLLVGTLAVALVPATVEAKPNKGSDRYAAQIEQYQRSIGSGSGTIQQSTSGRTDQSTTATAPRPQAAAQPAPQPAAQPAVPAAGASGGGAAAVSVPDSGENTAASVTEPMDVAVYQNAAAPPEAAKPVQSQPSMLGALGSKVASAFNYGPRGFTQAATLSFYGLAILLALAGGLLLSGQHARVSERVPAWQRRRRFAFRQ